MNNRFIVILVLCILNASVYFVSSTLDSQWEGTTLHDGQERLRIATQIGDELHTQTSVTDQHINEFGAHVRKSVSYSFTYERSNNGYVATSTLDDYPYSVKVKVFSLDEECSLLILPTVKIENVWLTCFVK